MRAVVIQDFDQTPAVDDLPDPVAEDGQVLIHVRFSSVNPVDNAIAQGMLREMFEHEFPVTLGRDFAGVVEVVGSGAERFAVGDEVFGFLPHADPVVHRGSWAEVAVVGTDGFVATKPEAVPFPDAGAAPLAGLTALAAVDALDLEEGEVILIVGATGGVGSFAVQLAKLAGARVVAPGLPEDHDYLRSLGVDDVVGRETDVTAAVREIEPGGVAALIDTVSMSPDGLEVFEAALNADGRIASPVGAAGEGPGRHNVMGSSDPSSIDRLAELLAERKLRVPIQNTYVLERATEALADLTGKHTQGKLAIEIA